MANLMQMKQEEEKEFKGPWIGGYDDVGNPNWVWTDPAKKKEVKKVVKKVVNKKKAKKKKVKKK